MAPDNSANATYKTILNHSSIIGDRIYTIKKEKHYGQDTIVEFKTKMSRDELKQFESDWNEYWIPTITDEQIENGELEVIPKDIEDRGLQIIRQEVDKASAGKDMDLSKEEHQCDVIDEINFEKVAEYDEIVQLYSIQLNHSLFAYMQHRTLSTTTLTLPL